MQKVWQISNLYVATLRAIYLIEQFGHWTMKGAPFYANHLMLERTYESAQKNADLASEKFIGCFGNEAVDYQMQCDLIHKIMNKYAELQDEPLKQSLAIEEAFLKLAEGVAKTLQEEGEFNLGIDDAMTEISSKRQEAVYLLGQTLKEASQYNTLNKSSQLANVPNPLHSILDTALRSAVVNTGAITSSFHGELQNTAEGQAYLMFFTPPLNQAAQTQILTHLHTFIKLNKPELESHLTFKFA